MDILSVNIRKTETVSCYSAGRIKIPISNLLDGIILYANLIPECVCPNIHIYPISDHNTHPAKPI